MLPSREVTDPGPARDGMAGGTEARRPGLPLVSVITATFNAARCLPEAIASMRAQTYGNIEWIVVDGASTDATVELIRRNEDIIAFWSSEPDTGIYDAWNKALKRAHGDWICFLGADDRYVRNDSLEKMMRLAASGPCNFVSGRMRVVVHGTPIVRGAPWDRARMRNYQVIAHPGAVHHRSLFEQHGQFDVSYRIAGDYDFLLRAADSIQGKFLDEVVVEMGGEGASNRQLLQVFRETYRIQARFPGIGRPRAALNFALAVIKAMLRRLA